MAKPIVFADIQKSAIDILDDDYTSKVLLKAKTGKFPVPQLGPVQLTIEDECKGAKGVEGTLTAKFAYQGVSFDKVKLKGDKYAVEASKSVSGVKFKYKGDPLDIKSAALSAEYKNPTLALTAAADKKKFAASAVSSVFKCGLFGGDFSYASSNGALSFNLGASALVSSFFASVVYSSKSVASFALSYAATPKLSLAAAFSTEKTDATVGFKYNACSNMTVAAKTTTSSPSAVVTYKLAKDATFAVAATSKFADIAAKPTFGMQLTIG